MRLRTGFGRPKVFDEEDLLAIADYMTENRDACVPDLKLYMGKKLGKAVSEGALRNSLKDLDLIYKHPRTMSYLDDDGRQMRLQWAMDHSNCVWDKVLYTDEATFRLGKSGVACWRPSSEANEHMIPKNIPKLQVWGLFLEEEKFPSRYLLKIWTLSSMLRS